MSWLARLGTIDGRIKIPKSSCFSDTLRLMKWRSSSGHHETGNLTVWRRVHHQRTVEGQWRRSVSIIKSRHCQWMVGNDTPPERNHCVACCSGCELNRQSGASSVRLIALLLPAHREIGGSYPQHGLFIQILWPAICKFEWILKINIISRK